MKQYFISYFLLFCGTISLFSQNYPPPPKYMYVDYTLPELKVINKELLECMDTINFCREDKPYLTFVFEKQDISLSYSGHLPRIYQFDSSNPNGYFKYKDFIVFICGKPVDNWFEITKREKRFHGKIPVIVALGGGDKVWYFKLKESEIISIEQSIEE